MNLNIKSIIALSFFFFISIQAQNQVLKIWNGLAPGTESRKNEEKIEDNRVKNVYQPDLTLFIPKESNKNRAAVLVLPGGGYTHVTIEKEGSKIAEWLNDNGIAAFVLKYRLNPDEALSDAQRALSFVRYKANEFNIDPEKIGVIGFSAGGHLAANLISHTSKQETKDAVDSTSCKPNFAILIYGWLQDQYQNVTKENPPTFLVHTSDDTRVPVEQSINYYTKLLENGVPAEMHIYEQGKHGFALEKERGLVINWVKSCIDWLELHEFIK